jgi:adenosylhomocysteine nucleosidase
VREKQRLYASYHASAVDMEAATVARIARGHDLYFQAIKVISDGADFEVDGLSRFATADGQFREAAFAFHAMVRPTLWGKVATLARNSDRALSALTEELGGLLQGYR